MQPFRVESPEAMWPLLPPPPLPSPPPPLLPAQLASALAPYLTCLDLLSF